MERLSEKIKQNSKTPYQRIADQYNTTVLYVGQIARGERTPIRGKGLMILNELKQLTQNN
ncbi:hypothetical protein ATE49_11005 [Elizabethkingia miricola]|uniref:XRE family transcriptional regulator n=1 Tax=Elizabethkingia miricola TaxID=172045 RepID=A0ABY3ND80_ELIMR|nr:hypothetical protein [Elizabethkingia miricola]OBS11441.1 hypothetical protein ATE49_11005 [Elizabethkingia miricola]TYO88120.1 hypothetical protein LX74_03482 [Elizabethkingia miricola]